MVGRGTNKTSNILSPMSELSCQHLQESFIEYTAYEVLD